MRVDDVVSVFLLKSLVGKDVFAYTLGYYENDYKPVNPLLTPPDVRDNLWTRLDETNGHAGLFNGNISWMITDLAKIGEINSDRAKGMQAMLYQYDQLHRIVQARSLTSYIEGTGFAARSSSAMQYDVDYSYDPNGNLLTLLRKDHNADTLHNFNYQYYTNTNKLRQVGPPEDITYSNGPVVSNNKLFRKIKVEGSAYIPQGRSVTLRALEEIEMDPDFEAPTGTDFLAEIVADSGMYQYDAIGNLILDQHEGVKIYWTPYGKVREVRAKNDSLITTFRYDGAGNRIEKRVRSLSSGEGWGEAVTHYVRDASGNVMGVYKDTIVSEHHVYGSSRLGMYTGGRYNGQLSLGEKNYELSNHLSNVLTTITDNIGMIEGDSTWATVVSTRDYYPFGLEMEGRVWSDTTSTYRYGFNGKEKDDKGEWGNVAYDYGFRIYDPVIARFKSVDPLSKIYAMLTPYQFASNTPISAIDRDGLEAEIAINSPWFYNKIKTAWDAGDTDEAQRLAWISINKDRPPDRKGSSEIKNKYKGAQTAGTFNWNEANPNVLTVFDSDGNELFRIIREDPPKIVDEQNDAGFWDSFMNLFDWDLEGSGSEQEGGIHFYMEGGPGFTRAKPRTRVESIDITALYTYLSTTKFGASGPPQFEIEEFVNSISGGVQTAKDLYERSEQPEIMDSCTFCHEVGPDLNHAYETVPTKGKYTKEQAQEMNEQLNK